MKTQMTEELSRNPVGPKGVLRLMLFRAAKIMAACLVLTLLFSLVLLQNYAWLFLFLGAIFGLAIFLSLRFLENRFGDDQKSESSGKSSEMTSLAQSEHTPPIGAVEGSGFRK
ncbi:MAG: hypothetical protein WCE90_07260 [Candidatus Zixiibacteriota bacterium]